MEDKREILKQWGYDITPIIEPFENPELGKRLLNKPWKKDIVLEKWSDEDIILFSNKIYDIIKKHKKE